LKKGASVQWGRWKLPFSSGFGQGSITPVSGPKAIEPLPPGMPALPDIGEQRLTQKVVHD